MMLLHHYASKTDTMAAANRHAEEDSGGYRGSVIVMSGDEAIGWTLTNVADSGAPCCQTGIPSRFTRQYCTLSH